MAFTWLATAACGRPALSLPADGGNAWHELSSAHFVVQTNVDLDAAQRVVSDLERAYWVMDRVAFPGGQRLEALTHVAVFDGLEDLKPLGYEGVAAAMMFDETGLTDMPPTLLLPGDARDELGWREVFQHELCHRFVGHHYPSAPAWLNEGLAEYFSTLEIGDDRLQFGRYLSRKSFADVWGWGLTDGIIYALVPRSEAPSLERLRALDYASFYGHHQDRASDAAEKHRMLHYASAWAAVHTLQSLQDDRGRFAGYLDALRAGKLSEAEAFKAAFGTCPTAHSRQRTARSLPDTKPTW